MSGLEIRPLRGMAEYRACVALQRRTWGESFGELVPPSMLMVAREMGGVASGAFDGDRLAGFVFGISGLMDGRLAHWSDMLAVDAAYRGRGLGRVLKLHQRERVLELGIDRMVWTFDPLVARNGHLNLSRLGATARVYRRDVYGDSDSPLHAGIGTDRLLADWALTSERVVRRIGDDGTQGDGGASGRNAARDAPVVATPRPGRSFPRPGAFRPPTDAAVVRVAVPADIQALKAADPALARAWRLNLREAFDWAFERGYAAVAVERVDEALGAYTLSRSF